MSIDAKIRKYQDITSCGARAIIAFGFWDMLRSFMQLFFSYESYCSNLELDSKDPVVKAAVYVGTLFISILDILFRKYIGKKAIQIVNNDRKSTCFILFSLVFLIAFMLADIYSVKERFWGKMDADYIISAIIQLTSYFAFAEMVVSCIMVRRLKNKKNMLGEG